MALCVAQNCSYSNVIMIELKRQSETYFFAARNTGTSVREGPKGFSGGGSAKSPGPVSPAAGKIYASL